MKKLASIFLITVLLLFSITLIGFNELTDKIDGNSSTHENVVEEKMNKEKITETKTPIEKQKTTQVEVEAKNELQAQEVLSAEDKAVKAEIAKYNKNAADFKHKKQEKIADIKYDLTFDRVGYAETDKENADRITYKTSDSDQFVYNANTGKLRFIGFDSNYTEENIEKSEKSIDIATAEKIAYKYASQMCDISNYTLNKSEERFVGYTFQYSKFVDGYRTADNVCVDIGFGGDVLYVGIFTDTFDGIELKINKDWISKKINEALANYDNAEVQDKRIMVYEGKPCLEVIISRENAKSTVHYFTYEE